MEASKGNSNGYNKPLTILLENLDNAEIRQRKRTQGVDKYTVLSDHNGSISLITAHTDFFVRLVVLKRKKTASCVMVTLDKVCFSRPDPQMCSLTFYALCPAVNHHNYHLNGAWLL